MTTRKETEKLRQEMLKGNLDLRRRAVLGAFLFNPAWTHRYANGFQARALIQSAPEVFGLLFNVKNSSPVASMCSSLAYAGYLYRSKFVESMYFKPKSDRSSTLEPVKYQSPLFSPTEKGLLHVLTSDQFDLDALPKLIGRGKAGGKLNFQYDPRLECHDVAFREFIRFSFSELSTGDS